MSELHYAYLKEDIRDLQNQRAQLCKEIDNLRKLSVQISNSNLIAKGALNRLHDELYKLNGKVRTLRNIVTKIDNGDELSREQIFKVVPALKQIHKVNQRIRKTNKDLEHTKNKLNDVIYEQEARLKPVQEIEYERRLAILEQREKALELKQNSPYETRRGDLQIIQNMLDYLEEHEVYDRQRKLIVELQEMIAVLFYRFGCSESYPIAAEMLEQYKVKTKYSSSKGDLPNISIDSISSDIQDIYTEIYGRRLDDSVMSDLKLLSKFKDTKGYLNRLFDEIKGK